MVLCYHKFTVTANGKQFLDDVTYAAATCLIQPVTFFVRFEFLLVLSSSGVVKAQSVCNWSVSL